MLKCLDDENNDFYIHIDAKVKSFNKETIIKGIKRSKIFFTERISVSWGGFSQIESELTLLKAALKGNYDYYHLLSGVDLPLKSKDEIFEFFEKNKGKEFIHFCTPEFSSGESVISRVKYYYPLQEKAGRGNGLLNVPSKVLLKAQKLLGVNRLKDSGFEIKCGAQWFSITHNLAKYVLDNESQINKLCKNGFCADEIFLQTLVWNSSFKENIYLPNNESDYMSCLRFIDWNRGAPYTFKEDDFDELISSDFLFARKFDIEKHPEICYKIANSILEKNEG